MSLQNELPAILAHIEKNKDKIEYNTQIFDILEGDLLDKVRISLEQQLSPNSFKTAMERVAPVNLFKKVVNKISTLYVDDPTRTTDSPSDQELVETYTDELGLNTFMEDLNKGFNSYKWSGIEIYEDMGALNVRVIPSNQFLPYSNDTKNPTKVTAIIKFMGETTDSRGETTSKFHVISADEFISIDSKGNFVGEDMEKNEGLNPFGVIPFVFASKSRYLLVPRPDKDDLKMSVLFPVLLTDLNFAAKFMAHSIFYGVDIDSDNLKISPDAFWNFKSDENGIKPEVGTIKSDVSISDVLGLAKEQIAAWLDTKNIKAGSIGKMDAGNSSSGISKMVDEADTTMERKSQAKFFKLVEMQLWRVIAQINNTLVASGELRGKGVFSDPEKLVVKVTYAEQKPLMTRTEKIEELKLEVEAGFRSTKSAIKELNPTGDIDSIIAEIEDEEVIVVNKLHEENNQVIE